MAKMSVSQADTPPPTDTFGEAVRAVILPTYRDTATAGAQLNSALSFSLRHWLVLSLSAAIGAAALYGGSYFIPRTYRSEVLAVPTQSASGTQGMSSLLSRYAGIASAVGLDLTSDDTQTQEAIALLQSRALIDRFLIDKALLPRLFPSSPKKTIQDGYRLFTKKILLVAQDKASHLITVRVDWKDRFEASEWANELISRLNSTMRAEEISRTNANLEHLEKEYQASDNIALRETISSVMTAQINRRMLATTQPDYTLRVIDPAVPADANKSESPKRILFLLLGVILGAAVGTIIAIRSEERRDRASTN
jgi:uncharacterized protein involved in exopolysaccharide biosynthesis